MFSGSMIGAGLHGNGRHWYNLAPEERVIAMKVRRTLRIFLESLLIRTFNSTGGSARLVSASHLSSARFQFAFS